MRDTEGYCIVLEAAEKLSALYEADKSAPEVYAYYHANNLEALIRLNIKVKEHDDDNIP